MTRRLLTRARARRLVCAALAKEAGKPRRKPTPAELERWLGHFGPRPRRKA